MKTHQTAVRKTNKQSHGFTLIELIAGMAMTLTVSALALQALSNSQRTFSADRNSIETGQKLSSVLDIISRDIRQAGEQINEARFPVITVIPSINGTGARLVLYRALSEPLPLCGTTAVTPVAIAAGTTVSLFNNSSSDAAFNTTNTSCRPETIVPPSTFPPKQQEWKTKREAAEQQRLPGVIHDLNGKVQPFTYLTEEKNLAGTISSIRTTPFNSIALPVNSSIYIIEKREYLICNNELKVWINSTQTGCPRIGTQPTFANKFESFQTIASNIERLDITPSIRMPAAVSTDPDIVSSLPMNSYYPTTTTTWQNIQGLKIKLQAKDAEGRDYNSLTAQEKARLIAEGKFYPRNILSARRAS
jgi:type II secretory pathway pseudopilin PulG